MRTLVRSAVVAAPPQKTLQTIWRQVDATVEQSLRTCRNLSNAIALRTAALLNLGKSVEPIETGFATRRSAKFARAAWLEAEAEPQACGVPLIDFKPLAAYY